MVDPKAISLLSEAAFDDVSHLLRTEHLESLSKILKDEEASDNDRYVASELLRNAVIASLQNFSVLPRYWQLLSLWVKKEKTFL